jgi:hypothetical protein
MAKCTPAGLRGSRRGPNTGDDAGHATVAYISKGGEFGSAPEMTPWVLGELASRGMYSTLPSDIGRSTLRLAVAAVIVGLAIPLLPLFGEGGRLDFIFSQGLPWRFLTVYLLRWWVSALVAVVGIWLLKRDRAGPAGGVFLAVGLVVAIGIAGEVLVTANFGRWQFDVVLALETVEAILLTLAGSRAIQARMAA